MIGYGTTDNGGIAEYCAVDQRQVYLLGENTSFLQGAMAEPVACCLHGKELTLKASYINPYTQQRALDLIDSGRLDVTSMIHEICGLDKLEDVLSRPELRAMGKYIIDPAL